MEHAEEIVEPVFPPDCKAAVILEPSKQAFDLPPTTVAAESATILRTILAIAPMWGNHLDTALSKILVQSVRIIGVVTDQPFYWLGYKDLRQSLLNEGDLVRRRRLRTNSHW